MKILAHEHFHRGILRLLAWGRQARSRRTFLFFPLAEADLRSLMSRLLARKERFGNEEMHHFIVALCSAASYMHRHKVLHRDLKPGNILVHQHSGQPVATHKPSFDAVASSVLWMPIIADFGNSLNLGAAVEHQLPTRRFCTLQYAAPEVLLRGMVYSFPSDIWSLGVTFAEMEHLQAVFPARADSDCDLTQLCRVWKCCSAVRVTHSCESALPRMR